MLNMKKNIDALILLMKLKKKLHHIGKIFFVSYQN